MNILHEIEVAWAAGLFEGEGSFSTSLRNGKVATFRASLAMRDEDVVRRFHAVVGVGHVRFDKSGLWQWAAGSRSDVLHVAELLLPFLGQRRLTQIHAAIEQSTKSIWLKNAEADGNLRTLANELQPA